MATFQELQDRINTDYLNRGNFIEQTKAGIKAAIRHYENRRWAFNETSVALATSAGVSFVDFPDNLITLDFVQITDNGITDKLNIRDHEWLLEANSDLVQNLPSDFSTYQHRINLHPVPAGVYAIPIHYIKRLPELVAQTDTNEWLESPWVDIIAYHAAKLVWGVSIRNDSETAKFSALEKIAYDTMVSHLEQSLSNRITPTSF